eukprot:1144109-Pelagomonas_calceolata.AAC.2
MLIVPLTFSPENVCAGGGGGGPFAQGQAPGQDGRHVQWCDGGGRSDPGGCGGRFWRPVFCEGAL